MSSCFNWPINKTFFTLFIIRHFLVYGLFDYAHLIIGILEMIRGNICIYRGPSNLYHDSTESNMC